MLCQQTVGLFFVGGVVKMPLSINTADQLKDSKHLNPDGGDAVASLSSYLIICLLKSGINGKHSVHVR